MVSQTQIANEMFDKIKDQLNSGTVPWHKPWAVREDCILSHLTGKVYSFRNRMLLSFAGEYLTFAAVKQAGGVVNKGAKSKIVYFTKQIVKHDSETDEVIGCYRLLKPYNVFHIRDTSLQPKYEDKWGGNPVPRCDALDVVKEYCSRCGVKYYEAGSEAFYSPSTDEIQVPNYETFNSIVEFWSTMFHELGHSTASRLDRKLSYAREELVAELTAALCLGRLGLNTEDSVINSAAYIRSWSEVIASMKPTDFTDACFQAQRAFNLIFDEVNEP